MKVVPAASTPKRRTSLSLSVLTNRLPSKSPHCEPVANAAPEVASVAPPDAHIGSRYALAGPQPASARYGVPKPV